MGTPQDRVQITVVNSRKLMKMLKELDPEARKRTVKKFKELAEPILSTAKHLVPDETPMRNWRETPAMHATSRGGRGWPEWRNVDGSLTIRVGGRSTKKKRVWPLVSLHQKSPAGAIYDLSMKAKTKGYMEKINEASGGRKASRTVWASVDQHSTKITPLLIDALKEAEAHVNMLIERERAAIRNRV